MFNLLPFSLASYHTQLLTLSLPLCQDPGIGDHPCGNSHVLSEPTEEGRKIVVQTPPQTQQRDDGRPVHPGLLGSPVLRSLQSHWQSDCAAVKRGGSMTQAGTQKHSPPHLSLQDSDSLPNLKVSPPILSLQCF